MRLEFFNKKVNNKNKKTKSFRQNSRRAGFMMIEAVLSIFILGTILVSFVQIISKTYSEKNNKINILIATSLAQEGIEVVRNARDNNWTNGDNAFKGWKCYDNTNNTASCGSFVKNDIAYNSYNMGTSTLDVAAVLKLNNSNYYAINGVSDSKFSRKVTITYIGTAPVTGVSMTSSVYWGSNKIEIADTLYDWGNK